jgi:hypothetical protein
MEKVVEVEAIVVGLGWAARDAMAVGLDQAVALGASASRVAKEPPPESC